MLRRVEIKSDDRLQLFSQVRIVADFEGGQVWLQAMFVPDAAYALLTDSHRFGHGARAPMGRVGGFLLRGSPYDLQHFGWRDRRPAPRAGDILLQSGYTHFQETFSPASCFLIADADRAGNVQILLCTAPP